MKIEFNLKALHFAEDAFAPKLSSQSFEFHYHKHHKAYVDNLNKLCSQEMIQRYMLEQEKFDEEKYLLEIIKKAYKFLQIEYERQDHGNGGGILDFDSRPNLDRKIFNNAAQHWNHAFFWESINPIKQTISANLVKKIEVQWGSVDEFEKVFYDHGAQLFGSGWIWLVFNKSSEKLEIIQTLNANTAIITENLVPLLVCDAWEHAYYIDYRNKRIDYLEQIIPHLNWEFADKNFNNIK